MVEIIMLEQPICLLVLTSTTTLSRWFHCKVVSFYFFFWYFVLASEFEFDFEFGEHVAGLFWLQCEEFQRRVGWRLSRGDSRQRACQLHSDAHVRRRRAIDLCWLYQQHPRLCSGKQTTSTRMNDDFYPLYSKVSKVTGYSSSHHASVLW